MAKHSKRKANAKPRQPAFLQRTRAVSKAQDRRRTGRMASVEDMDDLFAVSTHLGLAGARLGGKKGKKLLRDARVAAAAARDPKAARKVLGRKGRR